MKPRTRHCKDAGATGDNQWTLRFIFDRAPYLGNHLVTSNLLKFLNFLDTLLYVSVRLVTPNSLKFLNFLGALLYLDVRLVTPNPLKFLNFLDTLFYLGIISLHAIHDFNRYSLGYRVSEM